jgi:hypothetical protein
MSLFDSKLFRVQTNTHTHTHIYIQGVSGGIVNILLGGGLDYSEKISSYKHVSSFQCV